MEVLKVLLMNQIITTLRPVYQGPILVSRKMVISTTQELYVSVLLAGLLEYSCRDVLEYLVKRK